MFAFPRRFWDGQNILALRDHWDGHFGFSLFDTFGRFYFEP